MALPFDGFFPIACYGINPWDSTLAEWKRLGCNTAYGATGGTAQAQTVTDWHNACKAQGLKQIRQIIGATGGSPPTAGNYSSVNSDPGKGDPDVLAWVGCMPNGTEWDEVETSIGSFVTTWQYVQNTVAAIRSYDPLKPITLNSGINNLATSGAIQDGFTYAGTSASDKSYQLLLRDTDVWSNDVYPFGGYTYNSRATVPNGNLDATVQAGSTSTTLNVSKLPVRADRIDTCYVSVLGPDGSVAVRQIVSHTASSITLDSALPWTPATGTTVGGACVDGTTITPHGTGDAPGLIIRNLANLSGLTGTTSYGLPRIPMVCIEAATVMEGNPSDDYPSPGSYRSQCWTSVIHGVRGLVLFTRLGGSSGLPVGANVGSAPTAGTLAAEVQTQNNRMIEIGSALQADVNPPGFTATVPAGVPLRAGWRSDATGAYLIVTNTTPHNLGSRSLTVSGFTGTGTVRWESRTVTPSGGTLTDTFGPYAVHVYQFGAVAPANPPTAPSGLTASAASSNTITLGWTDNSSDESSFEIQQASSGAFTSPTTITAASGATSTSATGLAASTAYYFRIRAVNSAGNSAWSNTANATTAAAGTQSAAPTVSTTIAASVTQGTSFTITVAG